MFRISYLDGISTFKRDLERPASRQVPRRCGFPARNTTGTFIAAVLLGWSIAPLLVRADAAEATRHDRLSAAVEYLASDELEGRGIGTQGINLAADYIAAEFAKAGLNTALFDGTAYQRFDGPERTRLGATDKNRLALIGPSDSDDGKPRRTDLKLKSQFNPLALGNSSSFDLPIVFAGYGIVAPALGYDDFANIDVKGKAVLILRKEPRQDDPDSKFDGEKASKHSRFTTKLAAARSKGAAAVVFVNDHAGVLRRAEEDDDESATPWDRLLSVTEAGDSPGKIPVVFASRAAVDPMVRAALDTNLATLEMDIDRDLKPRSAALTGWRIAGQTDVVQEKLKLQNVVGVLEGAGPLADETIVVGAHYDHIGYGGFGSRAPGVRAVHPGADDNASGTAAIIEMARILAARPEPLRRRVVFIAFTGEETGFWGSQHYLSKPLFPLDKTVAVVNLDMVGRLRSSTLTIFGTGTATEFDGILDRQAKGHGFQLTKRASGRSGGDHLVFMRRNVPVMHFFSGFHNDYHMPADTFDKINIEGLCRVAEFGADVVADIAQLDSRPTFKRSATSQPLAIRRTRPVFGVVPNLNHRGEGFAIASVIPGTPAHRAGLKDGDVVVQFGDQKITNAPQFQQLLQKYAGGGEVETRILRDGEEVTYTVKLEPVKK